MTENPTGDTPPEPVDEPTALSAIAKCAEYRNQAVEIYSLDEEITEKNNELKALKEIRKCLVDAMMEEISGYTQPEEPLLKLITAGSATNDEPEPETEDDDQQDETEGTDPVACGVDEGQGDDNADQF